MKKINITDDISTLTMLPFQTLQRLEKKREECIVHGVLENKLDGELVTCLQLVYGDLYISIEDNEIQYKFVPSTELEEMLVNAITTDTSPLETEVDDALRKKITQAYKDLF